MAFLSQRLATFFRAAPVNANDSESSPLLRLPAELRNRIYDLVFEDFGSSTINIVRSNRSAFSHPLARIFSTPREKTLRAPSELALRQTCRKISKEVSLHWLEDCTFGIYLRSPRGSYRSRSHVLQHINSFARMLGPAKLSRIRHIELGLDDLSLFFLFPGLVTADPTHRYGNPQNGTARQQFLRLEHAGSGPPPASSICDLWAAARALAGYGMFGVQRITLHGNQADRFPLTDLEGEDPVDWFLILLKACLPHLQDMRVVTTVPVPQSRRLYIERNRHGVGAVCEWYTGELAFEYDQKAKLAELQGPVDEGEVIR